MKTFTKRVTIPFAIFLITTISSVIYFGIFYHETIWQYVFQPTSGFLGMITVLIYFLIVGDYNELENSD